MLQMNRNPDYSVQIELASITYKMSFGLPDPDFNRGIKVSLRL